MNKRKTFTASAICLLLGSFAIVGCSGESEGADVTLVQRVVESVTLSVADNLGEVRLVTSQEQQSEVETSVENSEYQSFSDLEITDSTLWAVYNGGVIAYDLNNECYDDIVTDEKMRTIAFHRGNLFIGGDRLYQVEARALVLVDEDIDGAITALSSFGEALVIGTEEALYLRTPIAMVKLFDDITVSELVVQNEKLWIGTEGQGLYQYDGSKIKKRFLHRDSTLFDDVTALASWNNHLYLGTPNGMFIYDGGRWTELGVDDGLPSEQIFAINADGWVIYVGTSAGTVSYFKETFRPVSKLAERSVMSLMRYGKKLVVGTQFEGLLLKSDAVLKTMVAPHQDETAKSDLASVSH